jgi:hypothetical protein
MVTQMTPMAHFADSVPTANAIQRTLAMSTPSGAEVRQAVGDLAVVAVKALEEAQQAIEDLAALVMALHPEVMRTCPRWESRGNTSP